MQLGELQSQIKRFETREVTVIALSVDTISDSRDIIDRMGLTFEVGSDPEQTVVKGFRVQNPETKELALHAVYIVDRQGQVFYRKVARRRPVSAELIDAIDAYRSLYPLADGVDQTRKRIRVAYPENIFQALIEITTVEAAPETVNNQDLARVYSLLLSRKMDDATIAFRNLVRRSTGASQEDLTQAAGWLVHQVILAGNVEAVSLGRELKRRIGRVQKLKNQLEDSRDDNRRDELLHQLASSRAGLVMTRAEVSQNSAAWNLNFAKVMLRSFREVAKAASR